MKLLTNNISAEVRLLSDRRSVATAHEQVRQSLMEYIANVYPNETVRSTFVSF